MSFIQCWTCNGNGLVNVIKTGAWETDVCDNCNGTGCDREKTMKLVSEHERTFPSPVPLYYEKLKQKKAIELGAKEINMRELAQMTKDRVYP